MFRLFLTVLFTGLIFGTFFFGVFAKLPADFALKPQHLSYICVGLCFLYSLIGTNYKSKNWFLTVFLGVCLVADYFLMIAPSEQNRLVGVCVFCVAQLILMAYSLCLNKSVGTRIVNIAARVALCLLVYFVLPKFFVLGTLEIIFAMYISNFLISLLVVLTHIKSQGWLLVGMLLFFISDVFVGLTNGASILGLSGPFLDFILKYNIYIYAYIPGLFFMGMHTVWAGRKKKE